MTVYIELLVQLHVYFNLEINIIVLLIMFVVIGGLCWHMHTRCLGRMCRSRIVEALASSGCSLIVHSVCIDFSYRWLACVPLYLAIS